MFHKIIVNNKLQLLIQATEILTWDYLLVDLFLKPLFNIVVDRLKKF